jgi:hypothetical protein
MSTSSVTLLFALLTMAAQASVVVLVVLLATGPRWELPVTGRVAAGGSRPARAPPSRAVTVVATLGSLYLSEIAHFPPCQLCWFQRIAMYPLTVMLLLAAWRHDLAVRPYALTLALLGAPISAGTTSSSGPATGVRRLRPDQPCRAILAG